MTSRCVSRCTRRPRRSPASLRLRAFFAESHVLTVGDHASTLQVALPGFFALAPIDGGLDAAPLVHLVGPGETSLLTLAPAPGRPAAFRWRDFLGRLRA